MYDRNETATVEGILGDHGRLSISFLIDFAEARSYLIGSVDYHQTFFDDLNR